MDCHQFNFFYLKKILFFLIFFLFFIIFFSPHQLQGDEDNTLSQNTASFIPLLSSELSFSLPQGVTIGVSSNAYSKKLKKNLFFFNLFTSDIFLFFQVNFFLFPLLSPDPLFNFWGTQFGFRLFPFDNKKINPKGLSISLGIGAQKFIIEKNISSIKVNSESLATYGALHLFHLFLHTQVEWFFLLSHHSSLSIGIGLQGMIYGTSGLSFSNQQKKTVPLLEVDTQKEMQRISFLPLPHLCLLKWHYYF